MTTQPEALRLAGAIDYPDVAFGIEAAAELCRQHALNGELLEALVHVSDWFTAAGLDLPASRHARAAIARAEGKL